MAELEGKTVDDITRTLMIALMARWNTAFQTQEIQKVIREEATKKIAEQAKIIAECKATCLSLGFDRDKPESWQVAHDLFMDEARALYNRTRTPDLPEFLPRKKASTNLDDADAVAQEGSQGDQSEHAEASRPPIRQIVLDQLATAFGGLKASEIREYIQKTYPDSEIHEKTVGMTLYRLLKEQRVKRDGHTWFFVPTLAETKNPGVDAPGWSTSWKS